MAKSFRPQFIYKNKELLHDYNNGFRKTPYISVSFPTYRELKRKIGEYLKDSIDDIIVVCRHRRGEWGEWFEHWTLNSNNKPIIIKSGWN